MTTADVNPTDPADPPPHLVGGSASTLRPVEGAVIHVRTPGRCVAAIVVNVDAEDPLSAVFTVDAVAFQPPQKGASTRWEKANTRPGSVRWANNMSYAEPRENKPLTWHYVTEACLPQAVLDMREAQRQ